MAVPAPHGFRYYDTAPTRHFRRPIRRTIDPHGDNESFRVDGFRQFIEHAADAFLFVACRDDDGELRLKGWLSALHGFENAVLCRPRRGTRRQAQDELAFRHPHAAYAGIDLELQQVIHLRQFLGAKIDPFAGPNSAQEFHAPDRGKKKERLGTFRVTGRRGEAGRLGQCFGQDHSRNKRITWEMPEEHRVGGVE
jgi:hypothetical protein